ncbi:MAG: hypothetical protein QF673_01980 [Candidatus Hydrothermarchaeota archaeon]|nr:hypothetical protein [Candidatus Hydrothermarchaeota archaeon]
MGYEELIDETYRYLYDTATYYGTGVEYLIGGIVVGSLLLLLIIIRLVRGKRKAEIIVKVLKSGEGEKGSPGVTISPDEVVITGEGKSTKLLKDTFNINMKVGKLKIMLEEPRAITDVGAPVAAAKAVAEMEFPESTEALEEIPVEEVKPATFSRALNNIAEKYPLETVTLITPEGLLVDSTNKTPEEDATLATTLLSKLELSKKVSRLEINGNGLKYLFSIPQKASHAIFLLRAKEKLADEALDAIEGRLKEALKLLPS